MVRFGRMSRERTPAGWLARASLVAAIVALCAVAAPAEAAKTLSVDDVTVTEPDGTATIEAVFTVTLSKKAAKTVKADYLTAPDTATGSDFVHTGGVVKIKPKKRRAKIFVKVNGDDAFEGDETFEVQLSNPQRAGLADGIGTGTIDDNDPAPDADGDGIPDHLDPCPDFNDPGGYCGFEPYDINDGTTVVGTKAIVAALVVTAKSSNGNTAWGAWQSSDSGLFNGLSGSGIEIDLTGITPAPTLNVGDRVTVKGIVEDGRVLGAETITPTSTGNALVVNEITPAQFGNTYDRVLIRITGPLTISSFVSGEWQMTQGPRVRGRIMGALPGFSPGKSFSSITGIGDTIASLADGVMPRGAADLSGVPMLAGFSPNEDCIEVGAIAQPVGTVSLDEPATADTTVTLQSSDPSVAAVPESVTILAAQSSRAVPIDALQAGTVELTASLGTVQLTQTFTVVDACEDP
jgi:hypothetical protein